jgi:elongation factor G
MKVYESQHLRNIALTGHAGSGKTTIAEAMQLCSGAISRMGSVDDKNSVSDYHDVEHDKGCSVYGTLLNSEYQNTKINYIDTPGYDDYIGAMCSAIKVTDLVAIVVNSHNGLEVGTENAYTYATKNDKPVLFIMNKLDVDQPNFEETYELLKDGYTSAVTMLQYPINEGIGFNQIIDIATMSLLDYSSGKMVKKDIPEDEKDKAEGIRNELVESIAETDEDLMNKYFEEGDLNEEDFNIGLKKAIVARQIYPVFCAASKANVGIESFMDFIVASIPSPLDMAPWKDLEDNEVVMNENGNPSLFCYRMFSEVNIGDMTYFKVANGNFNAGTELMNSKTSNPERFNQIYAVNGKKRDEVATLSYGDMGATVKLKNTHANDSLYLKGKDVEYSHIIFPNPKTRIAIVPKTKGEEEKVGMGLHAIHNEDPTLVVEHSQELRQMIIYSQGELHQNIAKYRLENKFKVDIEFIAPRVPYRETIQKIAKGSYRHKKQSGGAGQFAEVHMMVEPYTEDMPNPAGITVRGKDLIPLEWGGTLAYYNCIVGGVIDLRFLPAILKGIMEKMQFGPLTGSYVRDIRVCVYDGKMHAVDSNESAFKTAGMMVFKDIFKQANPKILEPIYNVEIKVPEEFIGDVMSDLPSRRGVILGIDAEGRYQTVKARMPLAELDKYATALRSMTQGRAAYSQEYAEYAAVPPLVQNELMDAYKKSQEEED